MEISIRAARPEDAHKLYQMIRDLAAYERAEHCVKVSAEQLCQQLSESNPPFQCAICEFGNEPAGFALYFYAYSTWEGTRTLYLEDLYVRPIFRGMKVGAALMLFVARIARQTQCNRFEWSVLDWNESAIGFYKKLGARPVSGWIRYRLDQESMDNLLQVGSAAPNEIVIADPS
jgi:GNAT superfamily N-acetyltransferase